MSAAVRYDCRAGRFCRCRPRGRRRSCPFETKRLTTTVTGIIYRRRSGVNVGRKLRVVCTTLPIQLITEPIDVDDNNNNIVIRP